jgi:hypothetical protein
MWEYPGLTIPENVHAFRHSSKDWFLEYEEQLPIVRSAWDVYNDKVIECAGLEDDWEEKTPTCDEKQTNLMASQCETAQAVKTARQDVGDEWAQIKDDVAILTSFVENDSEDRKNEWNTLTIVQCLLDHVHSSVIASVETGAPCPTLDSDPEAVEKALEDCHIVQRGCLGEGELADEDPLEIDASYDLINWDYHRQLCTTEPDFAQSEYGINCGQFTPCPLVMTDQGERLDCFASTQPNMRRSSAHLCIKPCEVPVEPEPIPPPAAPCTPAYIAREQAQFLDAIQATYSTRLGANDDYSNDALTQPSYGAILSDAGWAGCAPPLVCIDCPATAPASPCGAYDHSAHVCKWHEEYLSPGQSNGDTFRCLDGTCVGQEGVCNGQSNCADGSDEQGCEDGVQAYIAEEFECGAYMQGDFHSDVHHRCGSSGMCIEKVGLCNGINNCNDGSDELACNGGLQVSVEATSGRTINVVAAVHSEVDVFSDRGYSFDSLGHMTGKTFVKYSNDDKMIDRAHVMTKIRTLEPVTVYIVLTDESVMPWLHSEAYEERSDLNGVSFSGMKWTRHKEWLEESHHEGVNSEHQSEHARHTTEWWSEQSGSVNHHLFAANGAHEFADAYDHSEDQFSTHKVFSRTFPAGTISIPGNAGSTHYEGYLSDQMQADARGSFLIFVDKPDAPHHQETSGYSYGDIGSGDVCPTGDVSEEDCLAAAQAMLPVGTTQGRSNLVAGSWGWVPPGCSVQSHFTHGQVGDWAAHYNRGNGQNDGGYTKVCKAPATQYQVLGYGMSNCAEGKTIDTFQECQQAHVALGLEVSPIWTGNIASIPGLCSTRERDWGGMHHFHFNSNTVGTIRADLSPVCKV